MIAFPVNMNNANAYTELMARTQFVLDRVAFLKDVGLTLMDEGTPAADAKINVWLNNAYVPLIVRCIKSEDEAVRVEALWSVANMLGADTPAVRETTKNALTSELLRLVLDYVFLDSKDTMKSAAFLLNNYARFKNMSYGDAQAIVYSACAKGIITNGKAAKDLLWAANYAADKFPAAIPLSLVVNTLGDKSLSKEKAQLLRRLLGVAAEQDGLVHANLLEPTFTALERLLEDTQSSCARAEIFWILSNVVTEQGAPEIFYEHKSLIQAALEEGCNATNAGLQATYTLANFVSLVKDATIQSELGHAYATEMTGQTMEEHAFQIHELFVNLEDSDSAALRSVASEALAAMKGYADIFYPEVELMDYDDSSYDSEKDICTVPEIKIDVTETITATAPVTIPLARTEENIASEPMDLSQNEWHVRVPSAYELLYGSDRASCESHTVRHLVSLVERAMADPDVEGNGWVKVPMDTVLSVGDLVTLQHMGYVFDGEWLGVNPTIYSGY